MIKIETSLGNNFNVELPDYIRYKGALVNAHNSWFLECEMQREWHGSWDDPVPVRWKISYPIRKDEILRIVE